MYIDDRSKREQKKMQKETYLGTSSHSLSSQTVIVSKPLLYMILIVLVICYAVF